MKTKKSNFFRLFLSIIRLKDYFISFFPRVRKRLLTFFIFIALSSILWFFRALDEPTIANINYPVKFINLPKNKMLTSAPPEYITVRVKGNGYTILNNKITSPVINLDVNNFSFYTQTNGLLSVYLTSKLAKELLTQELNKGKRHLDIIKISPDTLYFSFAKTKSIKVAIKPNFADPMNLFAQQYMLNGQINITPDSVLVVGPANIIDTLQYIFTKPLQLSQLKDSTEKKIGLIEYNGSKNSINKVEVLIPIDRYTESKFDVPVTYKNNPDSINIITFPRTISVKFFVTLSNLNKLSNTDFHPFIDYNDIVPLTIDSKLQVHLDSVPFYAKNIKITPDKVDYLIELKNAESRNNRGNR